MISKEDRNKSLKSRLLHVPRSLSRLLVAYETDERLGRNSIPLPGFPKAHTVWHSISYSLRVWTVCVAADC